MDLPPHLTLDDEALVLWDVVDEHLEEAGSLWLDRERWLDEPRSVADTAALERRIQAHLDGLTWSGALAPARLARAAGRARDPGATFAATFALASRDRPEAIDEAASILAGATGPHRARALRALALLRAVPRSLDIPAALAADSAAVRAGALAVCRAHALDPGSALGSALASSDADLRCAALDLVAARPDASYAAAVVDELSAPEAGVCAAALRAGLIMGLRAAEVACRSDALAAAPREALGYRALLGQDQDIVALLRALDDPRRRADALFALGFTGARAAADACAAACDDPSAGPVACEAFGALLDVDPVAAGIAEPAPPPLSDTDFPPADRLALRPEDLLPVPDPGAVRAFWAARRASFVEAPRTARALAASLERSSMRRRHFLATHLAMATRGAVTIDTRSWVRAQAAALARARATGAA
ncbi:hypothetical protein WME91_52490 [Sorangium sp. So ce269]